VRAFARASITLVQIWQTLPGPTLPDQRAATHEVSRTGFPDAPDPGCSSSVFFCVEILSSG